MVERDDQRQIAEVTSLLQSVFHHALAGVYLHGSAVSDGLRPQSDIDILAVIDGTVTGSRRGSLLTALPDMSGRHPAPPDGRRCLEVMIFRKADLAAGVFPVRAAFVYGEWLRDMIEAGNLPEPVADADNTLVLAQARQTSRPLLGAPLADILPAVSLETVRSAMRDALSACLAGLHGDERNVLLTLARMWRTAAMGDFVSKDTAASWAIPMMPEEGAQTLAHARAAYLGIEKDNWENRQLAARRTALYLHQRVSELL